MSITQREWNKWVDAMNVGFDKLGASAPPGSSNVEVYVWGYFAAKHLASRAERRKVIAADAAIMSGVMPNTDKEPYELGAHPLYTGNNMTLDLKVTERSVGVDMTKLRELLISKGVKISVLDECMAEATRPKAKMHTFTVTPIVE